MRQDERSQIEFGMAMLKHLPVVEAPDEIWSSIEVSLEHGVRDERLRDESFREKRLEVGRSPLTASFGRGSFWAMAAVLVVLAGVGYWRITYNGGDWIQTSASSKIEIKIGNIGTVEVEPNTRVRVVSAKAQEHRLALAHGEIRAKISAPPRLFFVETTSGTAIDLGCEYALNTDESGSGLLRVTKGWVSFQWKGLESLVPAGASCRTRPHAGPGIPYFDEAPEEFKRAMDEVGLGIEKFPLNTILAQARVRDTLSLWHLLSRVDVSERPRVYDRIAALTPVPNGVSRDLALKLDAETLRRWKNELAWTW
jgi:hypothetical protein